MRLSIMLLVLQHLMAGFFRADVACVGADLRRSGLQRLMNGIVVLT